MPEFIWAAVWGWVLGCEAGEPELNWVVRIHDLCGLHREIAMTFLGVRAIALSLHVRMHLITASMMILHKKYHIGTYKVGNVSL